MTPAEAYVDYLALKRHFRTWDYDYFRYGGKIKASLKSFEQRRDVYQFAKLARQRDSKWLMISAFLQNEDAWVGDVVSEKNQRLAMERMARSQSLSYTVRQELALLDPDFNANLRRVDGQHPPLAKAIMAGRVSIETGAVLVGITNCVGYWRKDADPVLESVTRKCAKYYPFLSFSLPDMKKIIVGSFQR